MEKQREFDIVLWGATGFVGRRVAHHLAQRIADGAPLRLALGGRKRDGLEALRARLPSAAREVPLLVGDSFDRDFLETMAARTRVVCSAVGPYAKYGTGLVELCVRHGTDYCDISGETYWMRQMMDAHQPDAERSGARLIHVCGFDSVPSDLGVFVLQREAIKRTGKPCPRIKMRVISMRGGLNGGTAASFLYRNEQGSRDASMMAIMTDPYSLNPPGERKGPDPRTPIDTMAVSHDDDLSAWTMPFVMAPINTKVVRRSNALLGYPYGRDFRYEEAMLTGEGTRGWIMASLGGFGSGAITRALGRRSTRWLLKQVLPKPGEGPSDELRRTGGFELLFVGELADGGDLRLRVVGDGDPNTESTSKLMAEAALCLALDDIDVGGGFWTPASALGEALLKRVLAHDVLRIEMVDASGAGVMLTTEHPNVALLKRFDPSNVASCADIFAEDVVWHYFNPGLPDVQGDYVGASGLQDFMSKIGKTSGGTFRINPISLTPVGDELVVVHTKNRLVFNGREIETNVVVVFRIVDGKIAEVWDIPSVHQGLIASPNNRPMTSAPLPEHAASVHSATDRDRRFQFQLRRG